MLSQSIEILLIEDNPADVDLTQEAFSQHKMLVNLHVAMTGEDGLQYLSRTGRFANAIRPDLILLDLNLPGMDGREVLNEIKKDLYLRQIPVVILTTSEADLDILKSYSMGANCYIVKPVDFDNFSRVVMQIQDFWFSLVKLPTHQLVDRYQASSQCSGSRLLQKKEATPPIQVLQIEDSDADADLVSESLKFLSEPHFTLYRVVRLSDAFRYLMSHSVDIALLDLSLPDSSGFETISRFLAAAPNLPTIVLTGLEDKTLGILAVKEGAQDYLIKGQIRGEFLGRTILHAIERKVSVLELAAALEREHKSHQNAERAIQIRDEFISIASHELRTPLTSLKLQIQLLAKAFPKEGDDVFTKRFQNLAEMADRQIEHFSQLVETLLDFSRIQSGRLKLEYSHFDLNEIIKESIQRIDFERKNAGCEMTLNISQPVIGDWDRLRIEQVLVNLLSNGIKYARGKPLDVSVVCDNIYVWIRVKDNGPGIASQDQERIFKRFERATDTKATSGLGLGLYVVRQIIDAHGGTIKVESKLGNGSTFVVCLPLTPMGTLRSSIGA